MALNAIIERLGLTRGWTKEAGLAVLALGLGFGALPFIVFAAGSAVLGRYEGASAARIYQATYAGLAQGSSAAWLLVLGPYALLLLFRGLRLWWLAGAAGIGAEDRIP